MIISCIYVYSNIIFIIGKKFRYLIPLVIEILKYVNGTLAT